MIRSVARPQQIVGAVVVALGVLATLGITALSGTKTGVALALAAVLGPLAAYAAIVAPLIFPFSFFIVLVPFDSLLALPAFGTLTRLLAIVCGVCIVFWLLRTRRSISPDRAVWGWLLFGVWCATSMVWAINPEIAYAHLFTLCQLLLLYTVMSLVPIERRNLVMILGAVVIGGVFASMYGAYVFRHGIDVGPQDRLFMVSDNEVTDPNQFAAGLILPIAVAIVGMLRARSKLILFACIGAVLAMGAGLAVAGSRGAVVAVGLAILYIVLRLRTRLLTAGLGFAALCAALALDGNVVSRFSTAAASHGAGRLDIWRIGLVAFRDHFWVGAGFSNFPLAYDNAFINVFETHYTRWHRAPHNILLSTGVELGILGLVIFLIAWYMQFRTLRSIAPDNPYYAVRIAVEGALIGLFVAGLFLDIMMTKYVWLAFMLAMLVRNAAYTPGRIFTCGRTSYPTAAQRFPISS